eukprot:6019056-Pyramimonas_sp.AAC.1
MAGCYQSMVGHRLMRSSNPGVMGSFLGTGVTHILLSPMRHRWTGNRMATGLHSKPSRSWKWRRPARCVL